MFVAERILSNIEQKFGIRSVSTDGGNWVPTGMSISETKTSPSFLFRKKYH